MFLLRGALLVVSWRANSNKSVSVRKAPGLGPGVGRGESQKATKEVLLWLINFTEKDENGPDGFDLILMASGLVTLGSLGGKVRI